MYALSVTAEVNPFGVTPILTQEQLWQGLRMKAENPTPFITGVESWVVRERFEKGLIVEAVIRRQKIWQKVSFIPPVQVKYESIHGEVCGWAVNLISESEKGLLLTSIFATRFSDVAPGSPEEKERGDAMKPTYLNGVQNTIKVIRQLAETGQLLTRTAHMSAES